MAYVAPFGLFVVFLVGGRRTDFGFWGELARLLLLTIAVWYFSRRVLDFRVRNVLGSCVVGVLVFLIWIGPDTLFEGYRGHWLFENALTGSAVISFPEASRSDPVFLLLRSLRTAMLVPVIEELFWRGWLMRWIVSPDFTKVALGTYAARAFWITAILFASEHGPYWEVGLVAGVLYNWWMVQTKRLGDCILAHAVTNAALSGYIIATGEWQYWM